MSDAERFERCIRDGGVVVFPSDTVYGLACDPDNPAAVERLYQLKGRSPGKPSAVMFFDLEAALDALPELGERIQQAMRQLLPGGVTFLLENPRRRFELACGQDPCTLGLRVPDLPQLAASRTAVLQSSANLAGGPDARDLLDVPESIRDAADLVIDGGQLAGVASTVVDLRLYQRDGSWRVLRRGAVGELRLRRVLDWQSFFDPGNYDQAVRADVTEYDRLQAELLGASGSQARRILELGTGTGHTALGLLDRHRQAKLVGIDASQSMLDRARMALPPERAELRLGKVEDELPAGPFDLVASALCVHHLDSAQKRRLFQRARAVVADGGRLVLADVVLPRDPSRARVPLSPGLDKPSSVADQLRWLSDAGFDPAVTWEDGDLAVMVGET